MPNKIGRYEVVAELGRGGMATVYHARDPRFQRDVAIKVLPREFLHDDTFRLRFEREAQAIAALDHPAIVSVFDFGEEGGQPYLVMRHMTGGSLSDHIRRGPLSVAEAGAILSRVASALDAAHRQGIIHRDIKPSNILFDRYGEVYLADFGIVKMTEATAQLTGSGIVGTPGYMAPELARAGNVSPLIDVYALGVTLFQMLTGRLPFDADTPMGLLMAHMNNPIPSLYDFRRDLPAATQTVIERAMSKEPTQRYQSAGELADALQAAVSGQYVEPVRPYTPPTPSSYAPLTDHSSLYEPPGGTYATSLAPPSEVSLPRPKPRRRQRARPWLWIWGAGVLVVVILGVLIGGGLLIMSNRFTVGGTSATGEAGETSQPSSTTGASQPDHTQAAQVGTPATSGALTWARHTVQPGDTLNGIAQLYGLTVQAILDANGLSDPNQLSPGQTLLIPLVPSSMALIDGGPFMRGVGNDELNAAILSCIDESQEPGDPACLSAFFSDAQPVQEVVLSSFLIDITEVTNTDFATCVSAGACLPPSDQAAYADPAYAQHPVVYVDWDQAVAYCAWAGKRLPTEAEWEKAARWDPTMQRAYVWPWGDSWEPGRANTAHAGLGGTSGVGTFTQDLSPWGVMDMAGNVAEWVQDWYFPSYEGLSATNPLREAQPMPGAERGVRGGWWGEALAAYLRAGHRLSASSQGSSADWIGFRCAMSLGDTSSPATSMPIVTPIGPMPTPTATATSFHVPTTIPFPTAEPTLPPIPTAWPTLPFSSPIPTGPGETPVATAAP